MPGTGGPHPADRRRDWCTRSAPDVEGLGWRRLAFEAASCTVAEQQALSDAMPAVELTGVVGWVEALRQIKDDGEIAAIREAVRCAERAFAMLRAGLRRDETREGRRRCARGLPAALRRDRRRASRRSSPWASARPCRTPGPTRRPRIGDDDFVLIDWGATGRAL